MWQVFFDRMSAMTKVSCGYLMTSNRDEGPRVLAGGGFSFNPEALRLYQEHFGQLDPFWAPFVNIVARIFTFPRVTTSGLRSRRK